MPIFEIIGRMSIKNNSYLAGKLLLAMPQVNDPRFAKAVILIGAHDDKGAMGIVLNNPLPLMTFKGLLDQLNIKAGESIDTDLATQSVLAGGPVET